MTGIVATNIISPIGLTTEENYASVQKGATAISTLCGWKGIPGQVSIGVFPDALRESLMVEGFTWFESLVIRSVRDAAQKAGADLSSPALALIISTTKGNIAALDGTYPDEGEYSAPGVSAKKVAEYLGIVTEPAVVCNACISGVTAQVFADRLIKAGTFDMVVVCGADCVSRFCLAGFSSFKALSPKPCRPFDIERLGLNIGECAATIIFSKNAGSKEGWRIVSSHLDNDAYHVSAPSPDGEGVSRAIERTLREAGTEAPGCICAHGTATMFNDQMESKAIAKERLSDIPLFGLKGIYGHTMGAAGVVEAALSMRFLDDGAVPPTAGFEEIGVSGRINISGQERPCGKRSLLKIISGFGGCNGALLYDAGTENGAAESLIPDSETLRSVRITPDCMIADGRKRLPDKAGLPFLTEIYKNFIDDNPRFYKMDPFSRLVYVATGMLLQERSGEFKAEDVSLVLFNRSSSIIADRQHIGSFTGGEGFYPSPAVFINTLPNVVMGEIAAKYNVKGETSLLILPEKNGKTIENLIGITLPSHRNSLLVAGWVDCASDDDFEADLKLIHVKQ